MGIKNLHKFLRKHVETCYKESKVSNYRDKKIAVDINIYLYRYKSIHKERWLNVFINFVYIFKKYNICPVFVYDTKAPIEKNAKKEERKKKKKTAEQKIIDIENDLETYKCTNNVSPLLQSILQKYKGKMKNLLRTERQNTFDMSVIEREITTLKNQIVNISRHEIDITKQFLKALGISYYDSETEAETLCAHLCCHGKVDAVMSDDTDVLVYGTPVFITKFNIKQETCIEITYDSIIEGLEVLPSQFTDLCIMCGTDYNDNIHNIGSEKAFKMILKYNNLETIETEREDTNTLNFRRIREIFQVPETIPDYVIENTPPDVESFKELCQRYNVSLDVSKTNVLLSHPVQSTKC